MCRLLLIHLDSVVCYVEVLSLILSCYLSILMDPEFKEINRIACQDVPSDNSRNIPADHLETVIEIGENESAVSNAKLNGSSVNNAVVMDETTKMEDNKCSSCVIDVNCNDVVGELQRICRICHLTAKESGMSLMELIELGCGCKGELGVAHSDCAEAWFRVRGNRLCEICGDTAKNIKGVCDNGFMEDWNDRRSTDTGTISSNGNRRCFGGQPLCNFLMACLVIAFVLPWFFRVNMI